MRRERNRLRHDGEMLQRLRQPRFATSGPYRLAPPPVPLFEVRDRPCCTFRRRVRERSQRRAQLVLPAFDKDRVRIAPLEQAFWLLEAEQLHDAVISAVRALEPVPDPRPRFLSLGQAPGSVLRRPLARVETHLLCSERREGGEMLRIGIRGQRAVHPAKHIRYRVRH